jgi:DNA-binding CsgD family transcriptional regulator/tetratricopeptide (TPR) repeat protein
VVGRVTSGRLVGRVGELAELEAGLADAADGRPSLVFLTGESGVGKTRLLAELERGAGALGVRVLHGEAVGLGEAELPYGPLLGALRSLSRSEDPVLEGLPRGARAELASLLPDLAPRPDGARDGGDAAQLRLFEALLTLLDRLGRRSPVLLAIEDLHWADRSTRAFVAFLARSLRTERVLVVVTYRPEELHRRHPLRPLLVELERTDGARRVELAPLAREELEEVLADILGAPPDDEVAARLFSRSEGNPLYAEELLAAGLDGLGAPPSTLREALRMRMEGLSVPAQEVLRVVAVGGRVDADLVGELTEVEERALRDGLREAIDGHILIVEEPAGVAFRHALLREVAYDDLLPGERTELHLGLARALERREAAGADGRASAAGVAHHYLAAGDQPAALAAAVRAAAAAEGVHAHGEAAALLERALELWPRVADAEARAGGDRVDLLGRTADAHLLDDDPARAEVLARAALAEVDEAGAPRRAAGLLARLSRAEWMLNRGDAAIESARRALALLPAGDDSPERADLLAIWATVRLLRGRYRDAAEAARDALDAAAAAGDEPARGRALKTLGVSLMAQGDVDGGSATLRQALAIAEEHDRPYEVADVYASLADALHLAGRTQEALAIGREGLVAVTDMMGRPPDWLAIWLAEYAFEAGEWAEAAAHLEAAGGGLAGRLLINAELRRGELALGRGDAADAGRLETVEPLVARSSEAQFHGALGALLAELRRRRGDLDGARRAVEAALDRLEVCTDDVARIARVAAAGVAVEADRAQLARDRGGDREARSALARARALMTRVRAAAEGGGPVERAWRRSADAELSRARGRSDAERWSAAAAAWTELDRPYPAALARWREAEARLEGDDRAGAGRSARAARQAARRLGAAGLEAEVEGLAARGRLRVEELEEAAAPRSPDREGETAPFGLTPRERQVLALLAEGATNREIGASLYMAEKTASVHVSRILAKLDVRSRTQAAAVAHRLGLG